MNAESAEYLLVRNPNGGSSRIPLDRIPFVIGRQTGSDLVLDDPRVSRSHIRILFEDGHYILEDLNSRHGTWVNGARVTRHMLRSEDHIEFGVENSYQLTYVQKHGEVARILHGMPSLDKPDRSELSKLRSLVEVARAVQSSLSVGEVLAAVVDAALRLTDCERGALLLAKTGKFEAQVARSRQSGPIDPAGIIIPPAILTRISEPGSGVVALTVDAATLREVKANQTVAATGLLSIVCVPLVEVRSGQMQGALYLDSREGADLSTGNRELLEALAVEASAILENARLLEQERAKLRLDDELRIARDIQQELCPKELPSTGWFRAAGSSMPAAQVGGDYFDVRPIGEDRWAMVVADVSGKGVSSALLASLVQGAFIMAEATAEGIERSLQHLNSFLVARTQSEKYATMFFGVLDSSGVMTYANAGHCAPYLINPDGGIRRLDATALPVGMLEESEFAASQVRIAEGAKLVIFSDGVTDVENAEGILFGTAGVRNCLRANFRLSAAALHHAIAEEIDRFTEGGVIRDDLTLLVVEYVPQPNPA